MRVSADEALALGWITPTVAREMKAKERQYEALSEPKKHKYNAQKVKIDGIIFASRHEANRYCELMILLRAGIIINLKMQVRYILEEGRRLKNGKKLRAREYVSDFEYDEADLHIIEDAKGYQTREYKRKIKEFIDLYVKGKQGIDFREV